MTMSSRTVKFDTKGTLSNFIDSFELSDQELSSILIIESIANSIDHHGNNIDLQLLNKNQQFFFKITDDGDGMSKKQFEENYHFFSSSSKIKGEGIGFAGVGAKLCFHLSMDTKVKTTTIGSDGPLCSQMWWNKTDNEIKWDYASPDPDDLKKLQGFSKGTIYRVEIDYKTYHYLFNHYEKIIRQWYNPILQGLYPTTLTFNAKSINPKLFNVKKENRFNIKASGETFECYFYLLEDNVLTKPKIDFAVFGKYIKTDYPDWGGRIKPDFEKKIYAIVKADKLAIYLNFNKQGFKPGSILYSATKREVERQFSSWLKSIGALRDEDEIAPASRELSRLNDVLQKYLKKEKFKNFNPFLKKIDQSVLIKSKSNDLKGTMSPGSQFTSGTYGGEGGHSGTYVSGEDTKKSLTADQGDIPMEEQKRSVRGFAIGIKHKPNDEREAWVDSVTQFILVNSAHPFYLATKAHNKEIVWIHLIQAVVNAMAYYKSEEIFNNDYKKGTDLKRGLITSVWQGLTT